MIDRCPVTGAAATRMTREGFVRACEGKRRSRWANVDWRYERCKTCKGRQENWPPELTILEANMTAKKPTKPANATPETELLAKVQLDLQSREKTLERLSGMLGCQPGDIEQAMATMQTLVQEIRDVVEPEVAQYQCATLPDACKQLADLYRYEQTEAEGAKARVKELKAELSDAEARIAKLEDEGREAWTILDGAGAGTLIEVAGKRWKEIETLRGQLELARNTIKDREQAIEELEEAAETVAASPAQDGGEAANILNDLMRKLVDGRITLIHNA